jgi:zinc and cadmium transporter
LNFTTGLIAVLGTLAALLIGQYSANLTGFLIPFAAGGFIYIAGSDLMPEMHKETNTKKSLIQLSTFILGMLVIASMLLVE